MLTCTIENFTRQYLATALWADGTREDGTPLDGDYDVDDFDDRSVERAREVCEDFLRANRADVDAAVQSGVWQDEGIAQDLWLTQNRHGAGFWDRYHGDDDDLRALGKRLTDAAHPYGEGYVYENIIGGISLEV